MRPSDIATVGVTVIFGAITGWLIAGSAGLIVAAVIFGVTAYVATRANVRPSIVSTVLVGTMIGALIGYSIVEAICLPATCEPLAIGATFVSAAISFLGIGLVAALVTRSFDEYNERESAGLPPTEVGCEQPTDGE